MIMEKDPDYILDISGLQNEPANSKPAEHIKEQTVGGRKCIYVHFECCGVYCHIYKNKAGTAYEGRCPKCLRPLSVKVGPGGTENRFFRAK